MVEELGRQDMTHLGKLHEARARYGLRRRTSRRNRYERVSRAVHNDSGQIKL